MFSDEPVSVPLSGPAGGIESFCVEGTIDGTHAHAEWDGRWVISTHALVVRAELALAVDEVFAEVPGAIALGRSEVTPSEFCFGCPLRTVNG